MSIVGSELAILESVLLDPLPVSERIGSRRGGLRDGEWVGRYGDGAVAVHGRFVRGRHRDGRSCRGFEETPCNAK